MKKIIAITALVAATSASAFFNSNNGPYGNSNDGYGYGNGVSNWGPFDGGSNFGPFDGGQNWGPFTGGNNRLQKRCSVPTHTK